MNFVSLLCMSRLVRLSLKHIQRDFLWGGKALAGKPHLLRWATFCLDSRKGGLDMKCLSTLNKALICKWSWHFMDKRGALWNHVISGMYGEEKVGWCSREVGQGYGVGFGKPSGRIGTMWVPFLWVNKQRMKFWKDKWRVYVLLCVSFPSLFALADSKEVWVVDVCILCILLKIDPKCCDQSASRPTDPVTNLPQDLQSQ